MCLIVGRADTGELLETMGDVRTLVGADDIEWHVQGDERASEVAIKGAGLGDDACLCWVNLPATLVHAGFKVWENEAMSPEYFCEPVSTRGDA